MADPSSKAIASIKQPCSFVDRYRTYPVLFWTHLRQSRFNEVTTDLALPYSASGSWCSRLLVTAAVNTLRRVLLPSSPTRQGTETRPFPARPHAPGARRRSLHQPADAQDLLVTGEAAGRLCCPSGEAPIVVVAPPACTLVLEDSMYSAATQRHSAGRRLVWIEERHVYRRRAPDTFRVNSEVGIIK